MAEWQPIETAPRDGTPVLVVGSSFGWQIGPTIAHWWGGKIWSNGSYLGIYHDKLTHWMPLPDPPEASDD